MFPLTRATHFGTGFLRHSQFRQAPAPGLLALDNAVSAVPAAPAPGSWRKAFEIRVWRPWSPRQKT